MDEQQFEIASPDGEKFQVTVEGRKVSVQIPKGRKSTGCWVFDQCLSDDPSKSEIEDKAIEIASFIIEIYQKGDKSNI